MLNQLRSYTIFYFFCLVISSSFAMKAPIENLETSSEVDDLDDTQFFNRFMAQLHSNGLIQAAQSNLIPKVKELLKEGANVNVQDENTGTTPLHVACLCEQDTLALVTLLLKEKADPTIRDVSGTTALHYAALHNKVGILELLRKAGSFVNAQNNTGYSPCHLAAKKNALEAISWLHAARANMNLIDVYGETPLHTAILEGNSITVHQLLKHGAHIHVIGISKEKDLRITPGSTPFHAAARNMTMQGYTIKSMLLYYAVFHGSKYEQTGLLDGHSLKERIDTLRSLLRLKDGSGKTPYEIEQYSIRCRKQTPPLFPALFDDKILLDGSEIARDKLQYDLFDFQDALKKNILGTITDNNIFKAAYVAMPSESLPKKKGWGPYLFGWVSW